MSVSVGSVLRAYWLTLRNHRGLLFLVIAGLVVGVAFDAFYPYFVRRLVDIFASPNPQVSEAKTVFNWLLIFYVGFILSWRIFDFAIAFFESRVMRDLDKKNFQLLQAQSMRFFGNTFSGSLVKKVTRFSNSFEGIADAIFFQIGRDIIVSAVIIVIFFTELPRVALAFAIWLIFFMGINVILTLWKFKYDAASAAADSVIGGELADSFGNHMTVKAYAREKAESRRFAATVDRTYYIRLKAWLLGSGVMAWQAVFMSCFELYLIWWMIRGWEAGIVDVGDFVFFQSYILWLFTNLWNFGGAVNRLFRRFADASEMAEIYELIPEVRDRPRASKLKVKKGALLFDKVVFNYGEGRPKGNDVDEFSLEIAPGESIAFVGHSGAGKSTLVKLLLRYYDLNGGSIVIDGQNIAKVTQESLRESIALVPQQPELFHRSLRENISFARPEATEAELISAAKRANAWDFIKRLPYGLDTTVGERGVKLSGGERQRIALARAFLADKPILVLDEATSALDSITEQLIQKAISKILEGRTSIVIAHRLSTIMKMDRIVVLEDGRIVEMGSHTQLLRKKGVYAELWAHQSGGYIE